jgi:hypothetical protein
MEKIIGCALIVLLGLVFCGMVLSTASRPSDIERYMQTQEYKMQEAAHLTKWR